MLRAVILSARRSPSKGTDGARREPPRRLGLLAVLCAALAIGLLAPAAGQAATPVLRAHGEVLSWSKAGTQNVYKLLARVSGKRTISTVLGRTATPPPVAGTTAYYEVKAASNESGWSNQVAITYAGEKGKEEEHEEKKEEHEEPPSGTTYYVAPGGSDSNTGTSPAQAWKTVAHVNGANLKAGDEVLFQGGATFSDQVLSGNGGGSAAKPITYGSFGAGQADLTNGAWIASHDFLTFKNLKAEGAGIGGRGNNITVLNDTIGSTSIAINVVIGDNWRILGSLIHDTGDSGILAGSGDNGGHPLNNWVIEGNTITRTGTDPSIHYGKHGIYLKVRNAIVKNNTITKFSSDGISQRYGNAILEGNNISEGDTGIAFFPYDWLPTTSRWIANTLSHVDVGMYAPKTDSGSPPPGGTTHESFVIEGNHIGPLTGKSTTYMDVNTTGTVKLIGNVLANALGALATLSQEEAEEALGVEGNILAVRSEGQEPQEPEDAEFPAE